MASAALSGTQLSPLMRNTCPAKVTGTDKKVVHNRFGVAKRGIFARHCSLNNGSRGGDTDLCFASRAAPPGSIVFGGDERTVHSSFRQLGIPHRSSHSGETSGLLLNPMPSGFSAG